MISLFIVFSAVFVSAEDTFEGVKKGLELAIKMSEGEADMSEGEADTFRGGGGTAIATVKATVKDAIALWMFDAIVTGEVLKKIKEILGQLESAVKAEAVAEAKVEAEEILQDEKYHKDKLNGPYRHKAKQYLRQYLKYTFKRIRYYELAMTAIHEFGLGQLESAVKEIKNVIREEELGLGEGQEQELASTLFYFISTKVAKTVAMKYEHELHEQGHERHLEKLQGLKNEHERHLEKLQGLKNEHEQLRLRGLELEFFPEGILQKMGKGRVKMEPLSRIRKELRAYVKSKLDKYLLMLKEKEKLEMEKERMLKEKLEMEKERRNTQYTLLPDKSPENNSLG